MLEKRFWGELSTSHATHSCIHTNTPEPIDQSMDEPTETQTTWARAGSHQNKLIGLIGAWTSRQRHKRHRHRQGQGCMCACACASLIVRVSDTCIYRGNYKLLIVNFPSWTSLANSCCSIVHALNISFCKCWYINLHLIFVTVVSRYSMKWSRKFILIDMDFTWVV